jgi:hypothetical protein
MPTRVTGGIARGLEPPPPLEARADQGLARTCPLAVPRCTRPCTLIAFPDTVTPSLGPVMPRRQDVDPCRYRIVMYEGIPSRVSIVSMLVNAMRITDGPSLRRTPSTFTWST